MTKIFLPLIATAILLGGCANTTDQQAAGLTKYSGEFECPTEPVKPCLKRFESITGQDKDNVGVKADLANGTFEYSASKTQSRDAFQYRAAVDQAVSADTRAAIEAVAPGAIDAIIKAITVISAP